MGQGRRVMGVFGPLRVVVKVSSGCVIELRDSTFGVEGRVCSFHT
jgi:hypothetical protein